MKVPKGRSDLGPTVVTYGLILVNPLQTEAMLEDLSQCEESIRRDVPK